MINLSDTRFDYSSWSDSKPGFLTCPREFTAQVLQVRALQEIYRDFAAGRTPQVSVKTLFETYEQLDEVAGFAELYQIEDATTERS